jgi:diacylglycerol O-acyltransferase 1
LTPKGNPFAQKPKIPQKDRLKCMTRPSVLSPDASKNFNFQGFINLGFLLLVVSNFRLLYDNAKKYGLLWNLVGYVTDYLNYSNSWVMLFTVLSYGVWVFITFLLEKWIASYVVTLFHSLTQEY